jgi:hypothetical protein
MGLSFQPVTLDGNYGDEEAMLVLHDGRLIALLSRLGYAHGALAGQWFVETAFGLFAERPGRTFADIEAVEAWIAAG